MITQLRILSQLAEHDVNLRAIETELSDIPQRSEEMRVDLSKLEALLGREREELAEAKRLREQQEQEIVERQESLNKSKLKGNKARNVRETEAADAEMTFLRKAIKEREDERDRLGAAITKVADSLAQHELEFSEFKKLVDDETQKGAEEIKGLTLRRDDAVKERDALLSQLDKTIARRYQTLRQKIANPIVEVSNNACSGCRTAIPAQQINVMLRAESIEQCPRCMRFLVHPALLANAPAEQGTAPQTNE